jgi:uncharacterized protein (TIGR02646 family)
MVKIDKQQFEQDRPVQMLRNANPIPVWDGRKPFPWTVMIENRGFDVKRNLLPLLLKVTKEHCAFCDFYPLTPEINPVPLEHFEPKSTTPEKAYSWENLFPVCAGCTDKKRERFDENLLKPDDISYSFEAHFSVTGEGWLECKQKQKTSRAFITIDIYKLNRGALVRERKKHIRDFPKIKPDNPDEYPFRFLIPYACNGTSTDDIINSYIQ